jgi:hypothetical protein
MRGDEEQSPSRQAWLDKLQKGDVVIIRSAHGNEQVYRWATVDLIATPDENGFRSIYAGGFIFNKKGRCSTWHLLVEPTPAALNEAARTKLLDRMGCLRWKQLPVVVLARIVDLTESGSWESERAEEDKLREFL